ncbi:DUF5906 domain-containing protein, partial [Kamptonema formosum]|uniref:DUF5906 domain-containing protein n=1 Tax=Kamptonema formosum TaxID=331992 RepID=UPI0005C6C6CD
MYPIIVENTKNRQLAAQLSDSTKTYSFDIRDHIDKLEPTKEKDRFRCPVCGGGALTVKLSTGAYQCWSGGCSARDIREAISPQSSSYSLRRSGAGRRYKQRPTPPPAILPDGEVRLLHLPSPAADCPLPGTPKWVPKGVPAGAEEIVYRYSESQTVHRFQWASADSSKGREKTFRQCHLNEDGLPVWTKGETPWPAYREEEVLDLLRAAPPDAVPVVLMQEGEGCVEIGRGIALSSLTFQGSAWGTQEVGSLAGKLKEAHPNVCLAFLPDNDNAGRKKLAQVQEGCDAAGVPFLPLDPLAICPDLPEKGDVKEILDSLGNSDEFLNRLQAEISRAAGENQARIEKWERQFANSGSPNADTPQSKPPAPRAVGEALAEDYRPHWKFDNSQKTWRQWNGKFWEPLEEEVFGQEVYFLLKQQGIKYEWDRYCESVLKTLRRELLTPKWNHPDHRRFVNFANCVLDIQTGERHEHAPGFGFTSCLPHSYIPLDLSAFPSAIEALESHAPHTYKFLHRTQNGNSKGVMKLLAVVSATLKWQWRNLQRFPYLVGPPGAGKGTFYRLLRKVVGKENCKVSAGERLSDGNEIAAIIDKQLVVLPDERKACANIGLVLRLTGGDQISYRQNYMKAASEHFNGAFMLVSNTPIFVGETTGIDRRQVLLPFDRPLPAALRSHKTEDLLESEIENLVPIALSLPDHLVTELICGLGDAEIPEFRAREWDLKMESSSLAEWADSYLIYSPTYRYTQIGDGSNAHTLFGSYQDYCARAKKKNPVELASFSKRLLEICLSLGWDVKKETLTSGPDKRRTVMTHLRLRRDGDEDYPLIQELFFCTQNGQASENTPPQTHPPSSPGEGLERGAGRAETLTGQRGEDFQGFSQDTLEKKDSSGNSSTAELEEIDGAKTAESPPHVAAQEFQPPLSPSPSPGNPSPQPVPEPAPAPVTEISPAPAPEPAATEPVDWQATPASEENKGWAELLELAESAEDIRHLAEHYRSFYGHDYDAQKKEVWQLLTAGTKERIRQLVAATEPATVTEPAAPEGIVSTDTPEPLITPAEAATLLTVAQHCLPDAAAGPNLLALAKELRLEQNPELWQALAQACSSPVAAPEKEPYSYRSFPHADPHAKEETRRSQARQGLNQLLKASKAKDF